MSAFSNPKWLDKYTFNYKSVDEVPQTLYDEINAKLDKLNSDIPEVSITIAAWNEEVNMLPTISSLADSTTKLPIEIVVVNNNSTDRTQEVLDKFHIHSFQQPIQGCGPARQLGLEQAKGKYILTADADCIYPEGWIDGLIDTLKEPGVVCVYGRYSFIANEKNPRWKLAIYEKMKDVIAEVRHQKRPYLNTLGMTMGFIREQALKVGYVMKHVRGEDGRLTFDLMQFGKVKQVKDAKYTTWTGTRTIDQDGSLFKAVSNRVVGELKKITEYFKPHAPHDTKSSDN
ncbi:glycosyltransferase family 2 protein [Mucilaginibacter myungsuensis]|uniref:Glycosyltransferase family 2 protein n=1 Tax=Mucilaginibacter myungsuensis TaxID=649104 RepID=A0A929KX45_9SPHI|nr:glycosyltransferase family 2 protein [Mucilaginibacter myungsuensis]MBE9662068.1 glycosyltransferase family 2 protein [Mucilaginibacter myungsuensis]MDN3599498.1 glycosyltransferase family 2 protein [Mucilaginibacter myungsuensis]